jgi:hypothetical protein
VLARRLVRLLGEAADQLLVDVAHLGVADLVGVQVDVREAGQYLVEEVGLGPAGDLGVEPEPLDHVERPRREPDDVLPEVRLDVGRVGGQPGEVERRRVVELTACHRLQGRVGVVDLALELLRPLDHRRLGVAEHAVEAADHDERQDHLGVLGPLEVAPQQVGHRPDEVDLVVERPAVGERHPSPFARPACRQRGYGAVVTSAPSARCRRRVTVERG